MGSLHLHTCVYICQRRRNTLLYIVYAMKNKEKDPEELYIYRGKTDMYVYTVNYMVVDQVCVKIRAFVLSWEI